jgi:hypothetical protein
MGVRFPFQVWFCLLKAKPTFTLFAFTQSKLHHLIDLCDASGLSLFAQRAVAARRPSALLSSGVILANRLAPKERSRFDRANCPRILRTSFSLNVDLQCGQEMSDTVRSDSPSILQPRSTLASKSIHGSVVRQCRISLREVTALLRMSRGIEVEDCVPALHFGPT